jgi:isopentenyl diphosphate isomerase/L-lactate dehydrogenase-like FMN-dependent dehydrogenase
VWGFAVGGEVGVVDVLETLTRDLRRVMAGGGVPTTGAVTADLVMQAPA